MTFKYCIYKNCDNYINLKDRTVNEHITLFNFPKNPERRQIWLENGKASPNLAPAMYCYCSDHFDKRFLSTNNRRTALVGEAIPYPYVDQKIEETYDEEENLDCYLYEMKDDGNDSSSELILDQDQDIHVESTTTTQGDDQDGTEVINNEINIEQIQESTSNEYIMRMDTVNEPNKPMLKRKISDGSVTLASSSKQVMLKKLSPINQQQLPKTLHNKSNTKTTPLAITEVKNINLIQEEKSEIDPEDLIDTKHVTTFIFKGEEYVQMPRDHYIKEKIEFIKKLDKMERVVKAIKGHLNSLEF